MAEGVWFMGPDFEEIHMIYIVELHSLFIVLDERLIGEWVAVAPCPQIKLSPETRRLLMYDSSGGSALVV